MKRLLTHALIPLATLAPFCAAQSAPAAAGAPNAIIAKHSGKCLDINNFNQANRAPLTQYDCNNGANQQFSFVPKDGGYYQIVIKHSNKCVDVENVSQASGAGIIQYDCGSGLNQQFRFVDQGGGLSSIVARHSNQCLEVAAASTANVAVLQQMPCANRTSQQFQALAVGPAPGAQPAPPPGLAANMAAQQAADEAKAKAATAAAAAAKQQQSSAAAQQAREAEASRQRIEAQRQALAAVFAAFQTATRNNIAALAGAASAPLPPPSGNEMMDLTVLAPIKAMAQALQAQNRPRSIEMTGLLQDDAQKAFELMLDSARNNLDLKQPAAAQMIEGYYAQYAALSKQYTDARDQALAALEPLPGVVVEGDCPAPSGAPAFCWKDTVTRGVGTIPSACPGGTERLGALCYPLCKPGQRRIGLDCHSLCPAGWRNDGLFCRKAEYGRGVGYPWRGSDGLSNAGMLARCNAAEAPNSCQMWGAIAYPKCKEGWEPFGCCICRPKSKPNCEAVGLKAGIDLSCAKKIEIGKPQGAVCPFGKEMDAGLCYKACPAGYYGVGPVCWARPPANWVECGMGAAKDGGTCASVVGEQVKSVVMAGIAIGRAVASAGVPTAPPNPAEVDALRQEYEALKAFNTAFSTDTKFAGKINSVATREDVARVAAELAEATIPSGGVTGIAKAGAGVTAAYTYPKCSKYFQPGACLPTTTAPLTAAQTQQQRALAEQEEFRLKNERMLALQDQCRPCTTNAPYNPTQFCASLDFCAKTCDVPALGVNPWRRGAAAAEECFKTQKAIDYPSCQRIAAATCPGNDNASCLALVERSCGKPPLPAPVAVSDQAGPPQPPARGWPADCPASPTPYRTDCMRLAIVGGDAQSGPGNSFAPLKVRLRWRDGTPVGNFPVWFGCVPVEFKFSAQVPAGYSDNLCRVDNGFDAGTEQIAMPVLTDKDGLASSSVRGSAPRFGAPLVVVAEAGSSPRAYRIDHPEPSKVRYEWNTRYCAEKPDDGGNRYCKAEVDASSVVYFKLKLLAK